MRCDQHAGLSGEAQEFLKEYEVPGVSCPTCGHDPGPKLTQCGNYAGMFDEPSYPLWSHQLKSGGKADEFVQAEPWSSGPVFFLGLDVFSPGGELVQKILWPEEAIENA